MSPKKIPKNTQTQSSSSGSMARRPTAGPSQSTRPSISAGPSSSGLHPNSSYRSALVGGSNITIERQSAAVDQANYGASVVASRYKDHQTKQQASVNVTQEPSRPLTKYIPFADRIIDLGVSIINIPWSRDRAPAQVQPVSQDPPLARQKQIDVQGGKHGQSPQRQIAYEDQLSKMRKELDQTKVTAGFYEQQFTLSDKKYKNLCLAYDRLRAANERLSVEQAQLVTEKAQLMTEKEDYAKRLDRLAVVVENKQLYVGPQESDYKISEQFEGLFRRVKEFSFSFLSAHEVSCQELEDPDFRMILSGVGIHSLDEYRKMLAIKKTRRLLVQGVIGYQLRGFAFRRLPQESGQPQPAFDNLSQLNSVAIDAIEQTLWDSKSEITERERNDWRALTLTLVSRAEADIPDMSNFLEAERIQRRQVILESMMKWISEWAKPQENRRRLEEQLGSILGMAFELSLLLRKQRAWWFVGYPAAPADGALRFDPATMEDIDNKQIDDEGDHGAEVHEAKMVSMVIFPGLYKRGDTYGENYETEISMVKAQVRCTLSAPAMPTAPAEPTVPARTTAPAGPTAPAEPTAPARTTALAGQTAPVRPTTDPARPTAQTTDYIYAHGSMRYPPI